MLAEELEARTLTQKRLAELIGRPPQVVTEIVRGKKAITADTAIGLERALGISAKTWMNLQTDYELTLAYLRLKPGERVAG
jgi:HTH-type transcriptional regulator/antitoxin HigA